MTVFSRRQVLKIGATAAGAAALGVPATMFATNASAFTLPAKMDWWYAARFGMFIHFGSYSFLGHGEWAFAVEGWAKAAYQSQVSALFNPTGFNAATIVGLAKNAGMKYLVITAKHHEGFAMWDSRVASFTDTTRSRLYTLPSYTPYKTDVLGALKTECDRQGLRFGLYYSILDWNHASQTIRNTDTTFSSMSSMTARTNYINDMKAQLQELLTRYDPAILWFDGDWCADHSSPTLDDWWIGADGRSLYDWLIGIKPSLIVNERVKRDLGLGDYTCPEQFVPPAPLSRPWETNTTMNGAWGYNAGLESSYKSPASLIQEMVRVVSRDGNYLLNIGPKGDGTVTPGSVSILNAFGVWMNTYSDSIYGTTPSPFTSEPSWGFYTKKLGKLYAHVFNWPTGGTLQIPGLQNTINRIYLMKNPLASLTFVVSGGNINISVPSAAPDATDAVVVVEVSGVPTAATGGSTGIVSGAVYKLVSQRSGKALDNGNTTTEGAAVTQRTASGGTPQQWTITDVGGGFFKLISRVSGKALDNGNTTSDGAAAIQWTDNGGTPQQWAINDVGGGLFRLLSRQSGKALDNGNTTAEGASVIQWTANGGPQQAWQLTRIG